MNKYLKPIIMVIISLLFFITMFVGEWFISPTLAAPFVQNIVQIPVLNNVKATVQTLAGNPGVFGSADGNTASARFNEPTGMTCDPNDNLYVTDTSNHTIRKITPNGTTTTLAGKAGIPGTADGSGEAARFNRPLGITYFGGNLYVADTNNQTIRKVSMNGMVTTIAGHAGESGLVNGTGLDARFNCPFGITSDTNGALYVADTYNSAIRKLTPSGSGYQVITIASGNTCAWPSSITVDHNLNVYYTGKTQTIVKLTPNGLSAEPYFPAIIAGTLGAIGSFDGKGKSARFHDPLGITDGGNMMYVADTANNMIRKMYEDATVITITGKAGQAGAVDGVGDTARFNMPHGLVLNNNASILYVTDSKNHTIRKILFTQN